ncbi:hypothetical protein LX32DRAFT_11828 [Colletotrichum zoysiae]|uniref:Uncharacterized protein n=1 Tax=Colletotrichum zoysiae TaxID=1216348 RepID=A0AAD9HEG2_9PEZI|nr:hypothetical protein LX32DRAFT_11828 [Colletotrichum zoysiae]
MYGVCTYVLTACRYEYTPTQVGRLIGSTKVPRKAKTHSQCTYACRHACTHAFSAKRKYRPPAPGSGPPLPRLPHRPAPSSETETAEQVRTRAGEFGSAPPVVSYLLYRAPAVRSLPPSLAISRQLHLLPQNIQMLPILERASPSMPCRSTLRNEYTSSMGSTRETRNGRPISRLSTQLIMFPFLASGHVVDWGERSGGRGLFSPSI